MIRTTKNCILALMILVLLSSIAIYALETSKTDKPTEISNTNIKIPAEKKAANSAVKNKQTVEWQVPTAPYRLIIKSTKPELPGYIDLTRYCLPATVDNGIDIRNATGKKLPFKLLQNHGVIIDGAPQEAVRQIYFGFNKPLPVAQPEKNNSPDSSRLKLTVINGRLNYLAGDEWIKDQQQRIKKSNVRRKKYYTKAIDEFLFRGIMPRINFAATQCTWWDPQLTEQLLALDTYQQYDFNWRQMNFYALDLRRLRQYNLLLYYSLSGYFSDVSWRVRTIKKLPATQAKQLKKLPERVKDAPQKAFTKLFNPKQKRWKRMVRGTKAAGELNLERRPFNARRNFGAIFSGKLIIPQTGEYRFAINSTSSTVLQLDGKNIFIWLGAHNPAADWGKTVKIPLTAGLHDFKFLYHKASGFTHATVAWQPPGTGTFRMMNENDFAPGWINQPLSCSAADGTEYPLVKRTARKLFFTGKRQRATWTNFKLLSADTTNYSWHLNGKQFTEGDNVDVVFNSEDDKKITISDSTNKIAPLQLHPMPDSKQLLSMNPDLSLKLWLPKFIYDDELLNGQLEISSGLPEKINCTMTIEANRKNSILPSAVKKLIIPPKTLPEQQKFAANSTVKSNFNLNGAELKSELAVKLSLHIPGMVFATEKIRFIPLKELPKLNFSDDLLTDTDGTVIIPVLHRPSLTDLRKWELPLIIQRQLQGSRHLTVIADNFGPTDNNFATTLADKFGKYKIKVDFKPWHKNSNSSAMLSSLPSLLPAADKITGDTVIIIPPVTDLNGIASVRVLGRTIGALLERLQHNEYIRKIYLATPFPTPVGGTEREQELIQTLQKLCRTYGTDLIKLNQNIRQQNDWRKAYRIFPDNPALITSYPIQLTKESVDFLSKSIAE
jgi:PA14 domain